MTSDDLGPERLILIREYLLALLLDHGEFLVDECITDPLAKQVKRDEYVFEAVGWHRSMLNRNPMLEDARAADGSQDQR
jgi:hypothetical protein